MNSWLVSLTGTPSRVTRASLVSSATPPHRSSGAAWPVDRRIRRPHPRDHFFDLERLGHVVVGAAVDALHLLVPAAPRREHEDGHGQAGGSPAAKQRQAVDPGQPEVQHDGVVAFGAGKKVRALAVAGDIHRVPGCPERRCQVIRQPRFVFDEQKLHGIEPL